MDASCCPFMLGSVFKSCTWSSSLLLLRIRAESMESYRGEISSSFWDALRRESNICYGPWCISSTCTSWFDPYLRASKPSYWVLNSVFWLVGPSSPVKAVLSSLIMDICLILAGFFGIFFYMNIGSCWLSPYCWRESSSDTMFIIRCCWLVSAALPSGDLVEAIYES